MVEDVFDRAIGYPYAIPSSSYIYHNGSYDEVRGSVEFSDVAGLTPVLAVGSNQSPVQLARKFRGPDWAPIPVSRVTLKDFDTVYSAHVTGYGSIAATLCYVPGTTVTLFVNWLDDAHLRHMHQIELGNENYEFGVLFGIDLQAETGQVLNAISLYHGLRGIYAPDGQPVPLTEVKAVNRQHTGKTQRQMLTLIKDRLQPDVSLEVFVRESATDKTVRQSRTAIIGESSLPFSYDGYSPNILQHHF